MKILAGIIPWVLGALLIGIVLIGGVAILAKSTGAYSLPEEVDIRTHLAGRWDWESHGSLCSDSTHTIAFADSGRVMTITQQNVWVDSLGRDRTTAVYDIHAVTRSTVRGQIRGEERLTADGEPVVWDLVLSGPDEYRWHRTDWPPLGVTDRIVRCPADAESAARTLRYPMGEPSR